MSKDNLGNCNLGDWNLGNCNLGDWNLGNRNLGDWNLGYCNLGNCNLGDWNLGNSNLGDWNLGDSNLGNRNLGDWNLGDSNLGNSNLGDSNLGNRNLGDWNLGDSNLGDWNLGNRNLGYFNTTTPTEILIFNKSCKIEIWNKITKPSWMYFILSQPKTRWVSLSDLTSEEKKQYPDSEKLGGFLMATIKKDISKEERIKLYQEAAQKSWKDTTEEDRQLTFKLPNFDADIFYEIFGIDVREKSIKRDLTVEYITVNGKKYKCVE